MQIGLATLLADASFARMSKDAQNEIDSEQPSEIFRMHPFHSYKVIEAKHAKMAILQHHERLDGSGYPAKITDDKITSYTRIISLCDFLFL